MVNTAPPHPSKYSVRLKEIILHKFDALNEGIASSRDNNGNLYLNSETSINIFNVVKEVSIYENLFDCTMRCDIALLDSIGLFNHFPLLGEEIVHIIYEDVNGNEKEWFFVVRNIMNITIQPQNKGLSYVMECETIEILANDLNRIQQAFSTNPKNMIQLLWDEHIIENMNKIIKGWGKTGYFREFSNIDIDVDDGLFTFVVPNIHVFDAINMIKDISIGPDGYTTFLFYQNNRGFHVKSLQKLYDDVNKQKALTDEERIYKFLSNEIPGQLENRERIVSELYINNRGNSSIRLKEGYFNSVLVEVNPHQKAIKPTPTVWNLGGWLGSDEIIKDDGLKSKITRNDFKQLGKYASNTEAFKKFADEGLRFYSDGRDETENSNSTSYLFTVLPEHDSSFPLRRFRDRMHLDKRVISSLKNIDLSVVIPGTIEFCVGDLFNLQIEEIHGFTNVKIDDKVSGLFLITEVKHVLHTSGFHSTTLRLNKDAYDARVDVPANYGVS